MPTLQQCAHCNEPVVINRAFDNVLCVKCAHLWDHPVVRARMRAFARRIVYGTFKDQEVNNVAWVQSLDRDRHRCE